MKDLLDNFNTNSFASPNVGCPLRDEEPALSSIDWFPDSTSPRITFVRRWAPVCVGGRSESKRVSRRSSKSEHVGGPVEFYSAAVGVVVVADDAVAAVVVAGVVVGCAGAAAVAVAVAKAGDQPSKPQLKP